MYISLDMVYIFLTQSLRRSTDFATANSFGLYVPKQIVVHFALI